MIGYDKIVTFYLIRHMLDIILTLSPLSIIDNTFSGDLYIIGVSIIFYP